MDNNVTIHKKLKKIFINLPIICLFFTLSHQGFTNVQQAQKNTTLNILISKRNLFYYYENTLHEDGSNFKTTANDSKEITAWCEYFKQQNGEPNVTFILKIQAKDSLNNNSRKLIEYIKKQKSNRTAVLREEEKELIRVTEQFNGYD